MGGGRGATIFFFFFSLAVLCEMGVADEQTKAQGDLS